MWNLQVLNLREHIVIDHMQLESKTPVNWAARHMRVVSAILSSKKIFKSDGERMSKRNDAKITSRE